MTYQEALTYITQVEKMISKPGLERIRTLLARMGSPENVVPVVHVAGTNGKGSVTAFICSILSAAGYRVGRFTSPDLHAFTERVSINGQDIPQADMARITEQMAGHAARMEAAGEGSPTVFELSAAMAYQYFSEQCCDVAVMEVGLGGRLDATNVVENLLCAVITPIGLDHTELLGDTLAKIAAEKAGIIKRGSVAVSAHQEPEAAAVIAQVCREQNTLLTCVEPDGVILRHCDLRSQQFDYGGLANLEIALLGEHQLYNAALAVEAVRAVHSRGYRVEEAAIRQGLAAARWPGRFELLCASPAVIVDGAHNPQGGWESDPGAGTLFSRKTVPVCHRCAPGQGLPGDAPAGGALCGTVPHRDAAR